MANNEDIKIKIDVDISDVEKGMKDIEKASKTTADRVAKNADKMEQAYDGLEKQLKDMTNQTQKMFNNMNISGFTNAMNKVKSQVQNTMKQVQSTISKALNVSANIKVKATTDTSTGQSNKQGSSGASTGALLAGGAMGASLQSNLAKTKESTYDVIKAMGGITDSYKEAIKEASKFSRQSKAFETAKTVYDEFAQSIQDAGYEVGTFGDAVEGAFIHLQNSMRNASTESKQSMRVVAEALDNVIHLLSGNGLDNKLVRELMDTQQYLERISKVTRGASNNGDSPINENSVKKANRELVVLQGNLDRMKPTIASIMDMSREEKAKKSLGDSVNRVKELGDAYLKAHPIVSKFYNTLNNNSTVNGLKKIGVNAKAYLGKAVEWFKKLRGEADKAGNSVSKSSKNMQSGFKSLLSSITPMLSMIGIFQGLKSSVNSYTDSLQDNSKFSLTFGDNTEQMTEWLNNLSSTVTTSKGTLMDFSSNLFRMGRNMGASTQDSIDMSKAMTELGADLVAFTNDANSIEALAGALRGEYDSLQNFGYALSADAVEAEALALGLDTASESALLFARQSLILKQSGDILGYGAIQAQTLGGQIQMLRKNFSALGQAIGSCFAGLLQVVLPVLNSIVVAVTNAFNKIASVINAIFGLFGIKVGGASTGGGVSSSGLGGVFGDIADGAESIGSNLADGIDNATGGAGKVADSLADGAKSAKAMGKEFEKLLGIDEINLLDSGSGSDGSDSGSGNGGSGSGSGSGNGGSGNGAGGSLGDIADGAEDASNKTQQEVGEVADWIVKLANNLKMLWNTLKDGFLSVSDYINQSIANLKQAFFNLGDAIQGFLLGAWNNGGEQLVYNFGRLAGAITGMVIDVFGQVVQTVANLLEYLNPDNNPYTRAFIAGLNALLVACQNFALSVGGWFKTFLDNGGQAFLNVMGDICMILGSIFTEVLASAINAVTNFMNSWAGYVIISTVAISLNVIAGVIKALLLVIQKLLPLLTKLGIVLAGLMLVKVASDFTATWVAINSGLVPLSSMTTLGGKLANKLGVLLANVKLTRASIATFTKDLIKCATQGFKQALKFCGDFAKGVGQLIKQMAKLIAQFAVSTVTKIINFFKHPIATIKSLGTAILTCMQNVIKFGASLVTNAVKGLISLASQCYAGIASLVGLSVAEGTATAGAVALQLALDALGIGLIILAIVGLVQAFKNWDKITAKVKELWEKFMGFLQEKCPWLYNIFKAIGDVFSWVGEKVGWLWDKIKSFFGWEGDNKIEEEVGATDESLNGLGDTIEQTSERFGTSVSAINESLASIGIDSNKLALQLDEAEAMFNEKFNMISANAKEYLQAVTEGNEDMLSQMAGDSDKYLAEIKSAFEDMSVAEQAVFYATYGEINGVTDGWLDYTKGSYEDCLIKHGAMLEQITNNENLTYDEKLKRIDEEKEAFVTAQNEKVRELNLAIADIESAEGISEEQRYALLQDYTAKRDQLVQEMEDYQLGSIDTVDEAVKQSAQAQEEAYDGVGDSQAKALEEVDKSLEETKGNLSDFKDESDKVANEIPKAWKGIGKDIGKEFEGALDSVESSMTGILSNTKKQCSQLKDGLQKTFDSIKTGVKKSMTDVNKTITSKFTEAVNSVKKIGNQLKSSLQSTFQTIASGITTSLNNIKQSMTTSFTQVVSSITTAMNKCKSQISTTLGQINTDVNNKVGNISTSVGNKLKDVKNKFTKPFTDSKTSIGKALTDMNSTMSSRLATIVNTLKTYATRMKNTMNFNFPTPYLKMPHISVYGNWDFEKKTTPSFRVNWYSSGAIFNKRTILGGIGVGDAQNGYGNNAELVTPVDKFYSELNKNFEKQTQALAKMNGNGTTTVIVELDGKEVARSTVKNMKQMSQLGQLDTSWL